MSVYSNKHYQAHKAEYQAKHKKYAATHRAENRASANRFHQRQRDAVFNHYGLECACCKENKREFLSIDHINGGGKKHRQELKSAGRGTSFYRWLVKNNFPSGYRTLCMNCNFAFGHVGYCPHQKENLK